MTDTIDPQAAANVKRIFHLYAYENLTVDGLVDRLDGEGIAFRAGQARFPRTSVHNILRDRAYIGEILHKDQWYPGKHEPLIDRRRSRPEMDDISVRGSFACPGF